MAARTASSAGPRSAVTAAATVPAASASRHCSSSGRVTSAASGRARMGVASGRSERSVNQASPRLPSTTQIVVPSSPTTDVTVESAGTTTWMGQK